MLVYAFGRAQEFFLGWCGIWVEGVSTLKIHQFWPICKLNMVIFVYFLVFASCVLFFLSFFLSSLRFFPDYFWEGVHLPPPYTCPCSSLEISLREPGAICISKLRLVHGDLTWIRGNSKWTRGNFQNTVQCNQNITK